MGLPRERFRYKKCFTASSNFVTISGMRKTDQAGSIVVFIALGVFIVLFVAAAIFGFWAYSQRQDYKKNVDAKIDVAVAAAVSKEDVKKDAAFAEKEKNPLRPYIGPEAYGKVVIAYPKTWSATVDESTSGSTVVNGYFHPSFVPGLQSTTNFALRLQVVSIPYDQVLKQFDAAVKNGKVKVNPYQAPKVSSVHGARLDGELDAKKKGSMVLLPLRDKTIKIWTEADQFQGDFNNIVLANLTFVP